MRLFAVSQESQDLPGMRRPDDLGEVRKGESTFPTGKGNGLFSIHTRIGPRKNELLFSRVKINRQNSNPRN